MLAQMTGAFPDEVLLIGCQPEELEDYGGSLRPVVKAALEPALAMALAQLRAWGAEVAPRVQPPAEDEAVTAASLALHRYEAGRPPAELACRGGDDRFLA